MDKLGLLSLQVPILPSREETADGSSSMFMTATEPLPLRYTSPHSQLAAADAAAGRRQREGEMLRAGSGSGAFTADTSSSCSSCFWDDNLNTSGSVDTGIGCWTACAAKSCSSTLKMEAEKIGSLSSQCVLTMTVTQQEPGHRPLLQQRPSNAAAAAKKHNENDSVTPQPEGEQQNSNNVAIAAAAAVLETHEREPHRASVRYGETPAIKTEVLCTSAHTADAEDAAAGVAAGTVSVLKATTSSTTGCECPAEENSPFLQAAVAGVGSCSKGGSVDENICGIGTPTTRFSTEQEEDTGAAPATAPQRDGESTAAGSASSGAASAVGQDESCSSGDRALLLLSGEVTGIPSYEKTSSSVGAGFAGADSAAIIATEGLVLGKQDAEQQQNKSNRALSWKQDAQQRETGAMELQTQQQNQHVEASSQADGSLLPQDEDMNNLLAVAAAMVEEQVNGLTYVPNDTTPHGRARSEEASAALACAAEDDEAAVRAAAAALASIGHRDMKSNGFNGLDARREDCTLRVAANSSGGRLACIQRGQTAAGQEVTDKLALALSLDTAMLEVGSEAGPFPNSSGTENGEETCALPPQMRDGGEGSMQQSQNGKKQTGPTERVGSFSSHALHVATAKAAAAAAAGCERSMVTRAAAGGAGHQHTNGNGYAAELPEDPELVECLKGLLTALPRKKDAEARCLLSGEMHFVRPYALQIVDVWKIHLGEAGRTALKKDISERTQADPALKRRVLAISKLKMATLEELVQIAELADLLVRTLQIANMYETERQVASVTRQSASRRALNAAATAISSQSPPAATHTNTYYSGSPAASTSAAGGSSSHSASVNLSAATGGSGSTSRSSSTPAQASGNTTRLQVASSCSPSRASLVSPPSVSSPQAQHLDNSVSPRSRNAYSTNALLSPRADGGGAGSAAAAADEEARSSNSSRVFLKGLTAEGICIINNDSPPLTYESIERFASSRLRGLPMGSVPLPAPAILIERNPGTRAHSPSASSEGRPQCMGVAENSSDASIQQPQHHMQQQLQQQPSPLPPQQQLQKDVQQMRGMQQQQQPFSGSSEAETRCVEVDVAHDMREPVSGLQHSDEGVQRRARGELRALPSSSPSKASDSRSGVASPSHEWEGATDKRALPEVPQQSKKKKMLPQPRRSQQIPNCLEKDEDVIRAAELLAAVAELRAAMSSGVSLPQAETAVSSSVAHDEFLDGCTPEAAAASALSSPRTRALLATIGDNHRLSRLLDVSMLTCLDNTGVSRRLYLDQDVLTLLRLAAVSGDEVSATAFHGQTGASQGSSSSSSSEAEGATVREVDGELSHAEQRPVRRKRVRRPAKSAVRNGNRNRSAGGAREFRLDDAETVLLQQLHQQLQQLHQQQVIEAREATGEELSAALAGEVHACMSALEAEAAARSREPLPPARPATSFSKRKRSTEAAEDRLVLQDATPDADTEEEGSEARRRERIIAEAATLLQSTARNHRRCLPAGGRPAVATDCVEGSNAIFSTTAEALQSNALCKGTWVQEEESDRQAKIDNAKEAMLLNSEKEGRSSGTLDIRMGGSRYCGVRRKEEDHESSGSVRSSEERPIAAHVTDKRTSDGTGKSVSARLTAAKSDVDLESRGNTASRNVIGRAATYRTNSAVDVFLGSSTENSSNSCQRGRNGIRQGSGENLSSVAPYNTRRSAAAAAGACVGEGGEVCFADISRSSGSNGSSRSTARNAMQGEPEGKRTAAEKHDKETRAAGGLGDSVAEQCAREAKQLLERAFKVNDALGFLPASYRLMVGGFSREQETGSSGSNSGTGVRGKRSREQASTGEFDTCAFLQLLATVCLMCLKQ